MTSPKSKLEMQQITWDVTFQGNDLWFAGRLVFPLHEQYSYNIKMWSLIKDVNFLLGLGPYQSCLDLPVVSVLDWFNILTDLML